MMSSTTQHTMPPEFDGRWGTMCLNTEFPLPTMLCAGYSVKLLLYYVQSTPLFLIKILLLFLNTPEPGLFLII